MPKKDTWTPAENFIRTGIDGSYTKALIISTYHFNALFAQKAIAAIASLLADYTPIHQLLLDSSSIKSGSVGDRMGDTQAKNKLFKELAQLHLPEWQRLIGNIYGKKTTKYKALFSNGVKPFNRGSIENRISAIKTLRDKCSKDGSLAAVAALISTFYISIYAARKNQLGEKSNLGTGISNQQNAIESVCVAHFSNHGFIVYMYSDNPKKIASFTDWQTLQAHTHSKEYAAVVNSGKVKTIAVRKVDVLSKVMVIATVDVQIWVIDKAANKAKPTGIFIKANTPIIGMFPALGNPANRVFQLKNLSLTEKGNYSVTFL